MAEQLTVFQPGERLATITDDGRVSIFTVTDTGALTPDKVPGVYRGPVYGHPDTADLPQGPVPYFTRRTMVPNQAEREAPNAQ